jgi:hypothetical protein
VAISVCACIFCMCAVLIHLRLTTATTAFSTPCHPLPFPLSRHVHDCLHSRVSGIPSFLSKPHAAHCCYSTTDISLRRLFHYRKNYAGYIHYIGPQIFLHLAAFILVRLCGSWQSGNYPQSPSDFLGVDKFLSHDTYRHISSAGTPYHSFPRNFPTWLAHREGRAAGERKVDCRPHNASRLRVAR